MEDLGVERVHGRPIRLFELSRWEWEEPDVAPFALFVAAQATDDELTRSQIRRFAADAIQSGCAYVCAWGRDCELVHDLFDHAALSADLFVMSSWHNDQPLHDALHQCLNAFPDEAQFPNSGDSAVVLAVEEPWIAEVRRLIGEQDELARLYVGGDV